MRWTQYLPVGMEPADVITVAVAGATFLVVVAVWVAALDRDPLAGRAKALRERRRQMHAQAGAPRRRTDRQVTVVGMMRSTVARFDLLRSRQADRIAVRLAQAGWRSRDALVTYLFFKLSLPIVLACLAAAWLFLVPQDSLPAAVRLMIGCACVVVGLAAPDLFVKNMVTRRADSLRKGLPDALDLLVICAEAGLSLDAALNRVSGEIAPSAPELSDELSLCAMELNFLPERRTALENLNMRTDMGEIRSVVNALIQTEKYGTPLAQSLRVLASEYRNARMLRAEEKAARLPATLTVPMIIFILPALFVVLLGPAIIRAIDGLSGLSL